MRCGSSTEPLTGNSLAVVEEGTDLTLDLFQRIAREFNQSETAFLLPPTRRDADWRLRSFTPTVDRAPCQVVSTGVAHLLVPILDREAVDRIQPQGDALFAILDGVGAEGCYVFSLDARQASAVAYARFFNPTVGVSEDPATGTAAAPLAAHLVAYGLAKPGQMKIEQGTAMGRTSLIQVEVRADRVKVSGRAMVVASGRLML